MLVLGIDSSCDDTSVSIVEDGKKVLSSILSSQVDFHKDFQGVVPEIAARKHLEAILFILDKVLKESNKKIEDIDLIATTNRPGLIGSLLVGLSLAKGISYSLKKPLVAIDHIAAHIYSPHLTNDIEFPYIALVVSGGHTIITEVYKHGEYKVVGTTLDDAVGEAYDKVAKHLNLGYPGGPIIDKLAKSGIDNAIKYPLVLLSGEDKFNFSYSGLKTAALHSTQKYLQKGFEITNENIALAFQKSAIDVLYIKIKEYCKEHNINRVTVSGGVACNSYLRESFFNSVDFKAYLPEFKYTQDNAAMVAGLGFHLREQGTINDFSIDALSRVIRKVYTEKK